MKRLIFTLTLLLLASTSFSQASKNMTLVGSFQYSATLNDIWAWVDDSTGIEYAIVGRTDGVSIMDLSNPAAPQQIQSFSGAQSTWRDMKTWKGYCFVTNETANGLLIIDMNGVPGNFRSKDTVIAGMNTAHNIYIDDGLAYCVGGDTDFGGMTIFDVDTDPWHPTKVGSFSQRYVHDVYIRNEIAYAAEINDGLLEILDVSNPANVQVMGSRSYVNSFTHNTWLNDASNVVFTTDELAEAYIYAWDVSNPNNIVELDAIRSSLSNGDATPHNTHVLNDFLVTSYYRDGINIIDAARPHNLIEVGYYDTNPTSGGGTFGCWGAYPFLPSGLQLATDMSEGFFVFQPNFVRGCYLEGTVTDSITGNPISGADIVITTTPASDASDNNGDYATGVADAGTYTVTYSKFGYRTKTFSLALSNGQLVTNDVELAPLEQQAIQITVIDAETQQGISGANVSLRTTAGNFDYVSGANGDVAASVLEETYTVYAGRWGWRSAQETFAVTQGGSNSLVIELEPGYYDDFLFDFSWTTSATASSGLWERDDPIGTDFGPAGDMNPGTDVQNDFGVECYVTGNGGGNAGNDDVDNGEVTLRSPSMDLRWYTNPTLKFYRWFANAGGNSNIDDELVISLTDGNTTQTLITIDGDQENAWKQDTFNIQQFFPTLTANMQVIFTTSDLQGSGHLVEAGVDLFEVDSKAPIVGIQEPDPDAGYLTATPNPMMDHTLIRYDLGAYRNLTDVTFEVHDLSGRVLYAEELKQSLGEFEFSYELPAGAYIAALKSGDQTISTFKLLKQ